MSNTVKQSLTDEMDNKLGSLGFGSNDVTDWAVIRDTIYTVPTEVISTITHKHKEWFNENDAHIQALLEEKHHLHRALLNNPASTSKRLHAATSWKWYGSNFVKCSMLG